MSDDRTRCGERGQGLRALRVLPAGLPHLPAVGRGDGLPARPHPPGGPAAGRRAADPGGGRHFDRCLGCMACMTACPSGVQYDQLIEAARDWTEAGAATADPAGMTGPVAPDGPRAAAGTGPRGRRSSRCSPTRGGCGRRSRRCGAAQRTGLDRLLAARRPAGARLSARARRGAAAGAAVPAAAAGPAAGAGGGPWAAARGGRHAHRVRPVGVLPAGQRGDRAGARGRGLRRDHPARARAAAGRCRCTPGGRPRRRASPGGRSRRSRQAGVDAIVVNSAGCGSAMKEYERLFGRRRTSQESGSGWAARAARAVRPGPGPVGVPRRARPGRAAAPAAGDRAAYHDACHLGHAQRITRAAARRCCARSPSSSWSSWRRRAPAAARPGCTTCCSPRRRRELGARKAHAVLDSGAPLLVSANPGCTLQISSALASRGETSPSRTSPRCSTPPCAASARPGCCPDRPPRHGDRWAPRRHGDRRAGHGPARPAAGVVTGHWPHGVFG